MADDKAAEKWAAVMNTLTAAGIGGLLLKNNQAKAGQSEFPPEIVPLLQAIVAGMGIIVDDLSSLKDAIAAISPGSVWGENADYVSTVRIQCVAANQTYPVPSMIVPDGFDILVKAWPTNAIGSLIFVITNPAPNQNACYPLIPNESIRLKIKDSGKIYLFSNVAGSQATVSVEQRGG